MSTWKFILQSRRDSTGVDAGTVAVMLNSLLANSNPVSANTVEGPNRMDDELCPDTSLKREERPCMVCHPPIFFFKYMLAGYEIEDIDDVISALRDRKAFFGKLKRNGFRLMGSVDDHYAEFEPPISDDFYWAQCRSSGCYLKIKTGFVPPDECPKCGKDVFHTRNDRKRKRGHKAPFGK